MNRMAKTTKAAGRPKDAPVFTRAQLAASKRYAQRRDLLHALLEDDRTYTTAEVDVLIERFMKGKVS